MASNYILGNISTIESWSLMVCKANLVFGLLNSKLPNPIYQTQYTKPYLPNQIFTKSIEQNLTNQIYKIKSTKQFVWNSKNQI